MKKQTNRSIILLPAALVLFTAGAGGCMLSVEAQVPDIEVTEKNVMFAGVPATSLIGDVSMISSYSQKHPTLDLPAGLTSEVKVLDISLTATQGITNFDFIHLLRVSMSGDGDDTSAVELIDYQKDPTATTGAVLTMPCTNPVNTLAQLKSDSTLFTIDVAGTLPTADWAVDVSVRFAGKIDYQR
jgi:hypothetical protein